MIEGTLQQVEVDTRAAALTADAAIGDTTLAVDDVTDFSETGGSLALAGVPYEFDSATVSDPDIDDRRGVITLADGATVTVAANASDQVTALTAVGEVDEQWVAWVELADADEAVPANIPLKLVRSYALGDEQAGATVTVVSDGAGGYEVTSAPGTASTETATTLDSASITGTAILAGGVSAPARPPRVGKTWEDPVTYLTTNASIDLGVWRGLADDGSGNWVTMQDYFEGRSVSIDQSTGVVNGFASHVMPTGFHPIGGAVRVVNNWYALGYDAGRSSNWFVYIFDLAWVKTGEFAVSFVGPSVKFPAICAAGTTQVRLNYWATTGGGQNRLRSAAYTLAGTPTGTDLVLNTTGTYDLVGAYYGAADFGGTRLVAATTDNIFVWNGTTRSLAEDWVRAGDEKLRGLAWDGTRFHTLSDKGKVWHYSRNVVSTTRSVRVTNFDANPAGTGTHETNPSPETVWAQPPRQWMQVAGDPPDDFGGDDDPTKLRVYVNNQLQPDLQPNGVSAVYDLPATGGIGAPAVNGFMGLSAPGVIGSSDQDALGRIINLSGSGPSMVGPFGWNGDRSGTASSSFFTANSPDWSVVSADGFSNGLLKEIYVVLQYNGATVTVPASGDISNQTMGTLANGWRPRILRDANSGGAGRNAGYRMGTDGVVILASVAGTSDIASGSTWSFSGLYVAAMPV